MALSPCSMNWRRLAWGSRRAKPDAARPHTKPQRICSIRGAKHQEQRRQRKRRRVRPPAVPPQRRHIDVDRDAEERLIVAPEHVKVFASLPRLQIDEMA